MEDLTILMLTPNKVPKQWAEYHKKMLLEAANGAPIITISKEPLDWGINLIQTEYGVTNIYRQMLRGAQLATTTFIAMADDDTLYPREHFEFRPPLDKFAYNFNRWHLFTWGRPFYFHKPRSGNGLLIASRELVINAIEERLKNVKEGEELPWYLTKELGTNRHAAGCDKGEELAFYTYEPVVSFYHQSSIDPLNQSRRKKPWPVQAFDIPKWGRAEEVRKYFI